MRLAMEDVLYEAGVDVVLNGHNHAYERSNPVYVRPAALFLEKPSLVTSWELVFGFAMNLTATKHPFVHI